MGYRGEVGVCIDSCLNVYHEVLERAAKQTLFHCSILFGLCSTIVDCGEWTSYPNSTVFPDAPSNLDLPVWTIH